MNTITVVDARMGRGKSSAAIRYMNQYKGTKRFLYITPYLNEVDRICEQCDFDQSDSDYMSKSTELKVHMRDGKNIAATHALFSLMDEETLELVRDQHYSLIVDESIQVIQRIKVTYQDIQLILSQLADEDDSGALHWRDANYSGCLSGYKEIADKGSLYRLDTAFLEVMNPDMFRSFDEVFLLTYLFEGQYQKAYLDYFGFEYRVVGIEQDSDGFFFSDKPDNPPPIDYKELINLDNAISRSKGDFCNRKFALSKSWFSQRGSDHPDIKYLRGRLRKFFERIPDGNPKTRLWTSFKDAKNKIALPRTGLYSKNFLQICARATNEYRTRTDIAYLANRFIDPNLMKFFATKDIVIDSDKFALSEMLQWIWRSAIRDDKPINLYVPSGRMRRLLTDWIEKMSQGGNE